MPSLDEFRALENKISPEPTDNCDITSAQCNEDGTHVSDRSALERLFMIQTSNGVQPPISPFVTPDGLWGLVPPKMSIRTENPGSYFKQAKQPGVYPVSDVIGGKVNSVERSPSVEFISDQKAHGSDTAVFPALFHWIHGGNKVLLTGSFTDWSVSGAIPMIKSIGRHFSCVVYLPRGIHRYKFIVDDKVWHYCPRQHQEVDRRGNVNNVLNMVEFDPETLNRLSAYQQIYGTFMYPCEAWNDVIPDVNDMSADCPPATSLLLESMRHIDMMNDSSGYSAVLKHVIIKHCEESGIKSDRWRTLGNDVAVVNINLPCEHCNNSSPDTRLTSINFIHKRLRDETIVDYSHRKHIPNIFETSVNEVSSPNHMRPPTHHHQDLPPLPEDRCSDDDNDDTEGVIYYDLMNQWKHDDPELSEFL